MRGDCMEDMEKLKNTLVVQSNRLIEASYRLRIGQQKFLRLMASMVKKDDEDLKYYNFKIADVMELFDIKNKSSYKDIPRQLRELMGNILTFKIGKTTTLVPFLAMAQHDEGSGIIKVQFHPVLKLMYLCLNKENPFTIYELSNALKLRSTYSLRFYELLKQYQKIGSRVLSVEKIKCIFELKPTEYTRYNDFKRKVILRAQKEINEKTDISFEFEEIKTARKVTSIKFIIKFNKTKILDEVSATLEEVPVKNENKYKIVNTIITENITYLQAKQIFDAAKGNIEVIKEKYKLAENTSEEIKNIVSWMISAIERDYKAPISKKRVDKFNDFPQRDSGEYEDLEAKLSNWME